MHISIIVQQFLILGSQQFKNQYSHKYVHLNGRGFFSFLFFFFFKVLYDVRVTTGEHAQKVAKEMDG